MSRLSLWLLLIALVSPNSVQSIEPASFEITFKEEIFPRAYSGRVYLFLSKENPEPRRGPGWFGPEPFLSLDVENWQPDEPLSFSTDDPRVLTFPRKFDDVDLTGMNAQAVARLNPFERNIGTGPGNGYSDTVTVGADNDVTKLLVNQKVEQNDSPASPATEIVSIKSKLLSDFHQRPVIMNAAVTLPPSYQQDPQRIYPVIYEIPGFGGTHLGGRRSHQRPSTNDRNVEFIKVMLDPSCPRGHHVFANSANNGPVGDALVEELIPAIEKQFRIDAREYGRFLMGHSSGGWSSLWLQVRYPDFFGGVWSTSPDPVDFRDFQRINLYQPGENMFRDENGDRRPLARANGKVLVWYQDFSDMEDVLGYGGQLHSFEAVFSPRGEDGTPLLLWDRETGEIDLSVAETWKKYDINLLLKSNWKELEPKLRGKLHIVMGDVDTFYLEGATILLKETLSQLNSDAEVTILPGKDHMNLFQGGLHEQIDQQMADQYVQHRD